MHMKGKNRILLFVCAAVLLLSGTLAVAYARYVRDAGEIESSFSSAFSVTPTVNETFDGGTKSNVSVTVGNTDYPVYVRAAIVITWQDAAGTVYFSRPVETRDYTLSLNLSTNGWTRGTDGYYYYKTPVKSGETTTILINSCTQNGEAPIDGYALNVEVIVQTVQAVGSTDDDTKEAYEDAWGLS